METAPFALMVPVMWSFPSAPVAITFLLPNSTTPLFFILLVSTTFVPATASRVISKAPVVDATTARPFFAFSTLAALFPDVVFPETDPPDTVEPETVFTTTEGFTTTTVSSYLTPSVAV